MKKILSCLLVLALLCSVVTPVLAEDTADARLAAITSSVKERLGLDTSLYTSFRGSLEESSVTPVWRLNWSGDGSEMHISVTQTGRILSLYRYDEADAPVANRFFGPFFPTRSRAEAQQVAQKFLKQALVANVETPMFSDTAELSALSSDSHSFSGTILENNLPSPFGFHITVRTSDGAVTRFSLSGNPEQYLGGVPAATPKAKADTAALSLKGTLDLRLEYVLAEDGKNAVLRYLPQPSNEFYVDGETGKLVDLSQLYLQLQTGGASANEAAAADTAGLSPAEEDGVSKLENVLSKAELDAAARKWSALGLSKYTLASVFLDVMEEDDTVVATLQYAQQSSDGMLRRYVDLDGKTGRLIRVSSSRPWTDSLQSTVGADRANAISAEFLTALCPTQFARTAVYAPTAEQPTYLQYAQKENGYFFPQSSIYVQIDPIDGSICSYHNEFVPDVSFQAPQGIVSKETALNAWFATYQVTLGYWAVPQKLDLAAPEYQPLLDMGCAFLMTQKLGWALTREGWFQGVDAKTGKAVQDPEAVRATITYSDLSNHWSKAQAEKLAEYNVGWLGGKLNPGRTLTQRDFVALLVSASGYLYDPNGGQAAADELYDRAYNRSLLPRSARKDGATMNRIQMVKFLLDAMGYSDVASLQGIYKCAYADARAIAPEYLGYAALAQGMGLAKGDQYGRFNATKPATRAEALSMLYQLMQF